MKWKPIVILIVLTVGGWSAWVNRDYFAIRQAENHLRMGRLSAAHDILKSVSERRPSHRQAVYMLARTLRRMNRWEQLNEVLDVAAEIGVDEELITRQRILARAEQGFPTEGNSYLRRWLQEQDNELAEICEAFARGYTLTYRTDAVANITEAWIQDEPENPVIFTLRSNGFLNERLWQDAERGYRRALKGNPDLIEAQLGLARLKLQGRKPHEALQLFENVVGHEPYHTQALLGKGNCMRLIGRPIEADSVLQEIEDPQFANPRDVELILTAIEMGDTRKAWRVLEQASERKPVNYRLKALRGQLLMAEGKVEEAKKWFNESELDNRSFSGLLRWNRKSLAEKDAETKRRFKIGVALWEAGEHREAFRWLLSVIQYDNQHGETLQILSELEQLGFRAQTLAHKGSYEGDTKVTSLQER